MAISDSFLWGLLYVNRSVIFVSLLATNSKSSTRSVFCYRIEVMILFQILEYASNEFYPSNRFVGVCTARRCVVEVGRFCCLSTTCTPKLSYLTMRSTHFIYGYMASDMC